MNGWLPKDTDTDQPRFFGVDRNRWPNTEAWLASRRVEPMPWRERIRRAWDALRGLA